MVGDVDGVGTSDLVQLLLAGYGAPCDPGSIVAATPAQSMENPATTPAPTPSPNDGATTAPYRAEISIDIEQVGSEFSSTRQLFVASFEADVANFLAIPAANVRVIAVRSGSVVVIFEVTSTSTPAVTLVRQLGTACGDSTSALRQGNIFSTVSSSLNVIGPIVLRRTGYSLMM